MSQFGGCLTVVLFLLGLLTFFGLAADVSEAPAPVTSNADWTPVVQEFDGVEAVLVPAGCFSMGSDAGDKNEQPVHRQCFDEPFWIDRHEVTWAMFEACIEAGECTLHADCSPNPWSPGDSTPVNCETWVEARDYCAWRGARLPTEAEWEYAARGPDGWIYPWGDTFVDENVVYQGMAAEVGSKPGGASWVGAYDMSGNVWEWVSTISAPYPYDPADGREDPADTDSYRVLRGGAFDSPDLRAADRDSFSPDQVYYNIGFRCARSYD
jgi:formylglycine-generating enzyme required for sulfatase activity